VTLGVSGLQRILARVQGAKARSVCSGFVRRTGKVYALSGAGAIGGRYRVSVRIRQIPRGRVVVSGSMGFHRAGGENSEIQSVNYHRVTSFEVRICATCEHGLRPNSVAGR